MSISTRLTLILTLAAALLFGGVGYTSVRIDERELRFLVLRETTLLATSLELAFDDALRDRQLNDVQDTLKDLEHLHPEVDILVYDQHADLVTASEGAVRREPVERAQRDARNSRGPVERFVLDDDGGPRLVAALPLLRDRAEAPWVLAVVRPLDDMEKEMQLKRRTATLSVVAFAVLVAVLMFWLVRVHVGRPLAELVGDMRRVQGGDLSPRPEPTRHDEVGDALIGFAKLTNELRDAKARLDQEASERSELSRRLQEADKLVTIGQLSASLAHEIDTPLGVLEGRARDLFDHAREPESIRSGGTLVEQ
ncbi:MAG TPA: HAMP domain-containing protein, partial [Polyangiaceae bacterium]